MPAKRTLIEPKQGDKRYVRRDDKGQFTGGSHFVRPFYRFLVPGCCNLLHRKVD